MSKKTKFQKGFRQKFTKVKTAKGRKMSSTKWLQRHLNDPFTLMAKEYNYKSRAAFKLLEIDEKYQLIRNAKVIVDLGCAPGGWLQVARQINNNAQIIGLDLLEIEEIPKIEFIQGDFLQQEVKDRLIEKLDGKKIDLIISDISPLTCGHQNTDHLRLIGVLEDISLFIDEYLVQGGAFIAKIFQGSESDQYCNQLRQKFASLKYHKPESSRKDSKEQYIICQNYK